MRIKKNCLEAEENRAKMYGVDGLRLAEEKTVGVRWRLILVLFKRNIALNPIAAPNYKMAANLKSNNPEKN